jgi:hypothetical protein
VTWASAFQAAALIVRIAAAQPVPDDEDDPANHPPVINSGNTMRQREKRLDPAHLGLGQQKHISHGDTSLRRH